MGGATLEEMTMAKGERDRVCERLTRRIADLERQNEDLRDRIRWFETGYELLPVKNEESMEKCFGIVLLNWKLAGMNYRDVLKCEIGWDNEARSYWVRFLIQNDVSLIHQLVNGVAAKSNCRCGSPLVLADHAVYQLHPDTFEFRGLYKCPQCRNKRPTTLATLKAALKKLGTFKKVEIGAKGVKLERE